MFPLKAVCLDSQLLDLAASLHCIYSECWASDCTGSPFPAFPQSFPRIFPICCDRVLQCCAKKKLGGNASREGHPNDERSHR
eukprot:887616-Amphidinium_carterae.1